MATWNDVFHETPAGGDVPSDIDNDIRELKDAIEERMNNQHTTYTGDSTSGTESNDWLHKSGAAVLWNQNTAPTITLKAAQDGALWWDADDELLKMYDYDSDSWITIYQKDPVGTVKFWDTDTGGAWTDNSTMPGWYQCNGSNGTPDMRNLYVLCSTTSGAGNSTNELSGGVCSVTIGENNLPEHTHAVTDTHYHYLFGDSVGTSGYPNLTTATVVAQGAYGFSDVGAKQYAMKASTSVAAAVGKSSTPVSGLEATGNNTTTATALNVTMPQYKLIPIIRIS